MTKNNLNEHLTWLIATESSKPQPPRPSSDNSLPSQNFSGYRNEETLFEAGIVRSGECPDNGGSCGGEEEEDYSENLRPSVSQLPPSLSHETMGRLQSGPRASNKPTLLSQPLFQSSQMTTASQNLLSNISRRDRGVATNVQSVSGILTPSPTLQICR